MNKYIIPKLIGLAVLVMATLVVISIIEVTIYSYLINPGHESSFYEEHAQYSAPYISGIFGFVVFFFIARYWTNKGYDDVSRLAWLFPLTYVLLDLVIVVSAGGVEWSSFIWIFVSANAAKFLGCYLGYWLYKATKMVPQTPERK